MEDFKIEAANIDALTSPSINFNAEKGICIISGDSFMDNVYEFYEPILQWLRDYTTKIKKPLTFIFKISYYNSSSSRGINSIFEILRNYKENKGIVNIEWHYNSIDDEMEEEITDFAVDNDIEITLIPY